MTDIDRFRSMLLNFKLYKNHSDYFDGFTDGVLTVIMDFNEAYPDFKIDLEKLDYTGGQ